MDTLCQRYVLCMLRLNGYEILEYDVQGYDILATDGEYDYYIEVKCGPSTDLTDYQSAFKDAIDNIAPEVGYNARYVVCQFDDDGNLIKDEMCAYLLTTPARS